MHLQFQRFVTTCLLLAAVLATASALGQEKSSLSGEIGAVIEAEGIDAAKQRFAEVYPAHKDDYEVDIQGMMALGQGYMQAGDMESGMAVMEMMSVISQDMASPSSSRHCSKKAS